MDNDLFARLDIDSKSKSPKCLVTASPHMFCETISKIVVVIGVPCGHVPVFHQLLYIQPMRKYVPQRPQPVPLCNCKRCAGVGVHNNLETESEI